jgi:hypothetical protein
MPPQPFRLLKTVGERNLSNLMTTPVEGAIDIGY